LLPQFSQGLHADLISLSSGPLLPHTKARLGLLLYGHLTEVDAIYTILDNMISVIEGKRCSFDPFINLYQNRRSQLSRIPPSASRVVKEIKNHARVAGQNELVGVLDWFFDESVRNAFFHSDYILHDAEFRSRESHFLQINGTYSQSLSLDRLADKINRAVIFYVTFMSVFVSHKESYRENKMVRGRFASDGSVIPVELLANRSNGLYGFRG